MVVSFCKHTELKKHGKDRNGHQRYRCCLCGQTQVDTAHRKLGDMRLPTDKAVMVLRLLLEGTSIRAIERLTGVSKRAILSLLVLVGERCQRFWKERMTGLKADDIECDEVWGFVGMKERTRKLNNIDDEAVGDVYCFIAIERTTKLVMAYYHGKRSTDATNHFVYRLAQATVGTAQITTDGWPSYQNAIPYYMQGRGMDYAALIKIYGQQTNKGEGKYSPAPITAIRKEAILGNPNQDRVSTSHVERQNLSIRMGVRRMTRLTNAFSKKWENHMAAMALWFVWYNFGRKHMTLKQTPAMAHGLADHAWLEVIVEEDGDLNEFEASIPLGIPPKPKAD